jgi:hypothetical protein
MIIPADPLTRKALPFKGLFQVFYSHGTLGEGGGDICLALRFFTAAETPLLLQQ